MVDTTGVIESLGPLAPLFFLLIGIGLPVQFALGGAIAFGRRTPASLALLVPALLLALGGAASAMELRAAADAIREAGDPAWIPWFALQDRARAAIPGLAGALGSLLCVLPVLVGAATRVVLATHRSTWPVFVGVPLGLLVGLCTVTAGGTRAVPVGAALAVLVIGSALACVEVQPRSASGALTGVGSLILGGMSLGLVYALGLEADMLRALPNFNAPFLALPAVDATAELARANGALVAPWVLVGWLAALPAVFARAASGASRADGADGVGIVVLAAASLTAWGWEGLQWETLSRRAGAQVSAVLVEGAGTSLPMLAPVPPRVLYVLPAGSRWIEMGESGGSRVRSEPTAIDSVGPLLHLGDGVVFPPRMTMDDVYFAFADANAGAVQLVSCLPASGAIAAAVLRDPLRATGRCGAVPIFLRVTRDLAHPVKLIVLKDGEVDDRGDVYAVGEIGTHNAVGGRDVILRAQVDATVEDFAAVLRAVRGAARVYLGWGVDMDGDDLPIGVNPGLRVRTSTAPAPPEQ